MWFCVGTIFCTVLYYTAICRLSDRPCGEAACRDSNPDGWSYSTSLYVSLPSLTSRVGKLPRPWMDTSSFMRSLSLRAETMAIAPPSTSLLNQSITFLLYSVTRKCVIEGNEEWFQSLNEVFLNRFFRPSKNVYEKISTFSFKIFPTEFLLSWIPIHPRPIYCIDYCPTAGWRSVSISCLVTCSYEKTENRWSWK